MVATIGGKTQNSLIMTITVDKDIVRGDKLLFKKGLSFEFPNELSIITSKNGIGKSTFLKAIKQLDTKKTWNHSDDTLKDTVSIDTEHKIYSIFSKEDDSQGYSMMDMGLFLDNNGLARMNKSAGESNLIALHLLLQDLKKCNSKLPRLILLDEIDQSFDIRIQLQLSNLLFNLSRYGKVIYVTHNYLLIEKFGAYLLEDGNFTKKTGKEILDYYDNN